MVARLHRYQAIILRRTNYGEADRIINFITPDGEVSALARGVRKQKSKLAGGIELLSLVDIVVADGRSGLGTVTSSRLINYYSEIIKDYDRMQLASKVLKNIARFSKGIDDSSWFEITKQAMEALNKPQFDLRLINAWFNLKIAALLGEPLNLATDVDGQKITSNQNYFYDVSGRALKASSTGNLSLNHLKLLRLISASDPGLIFRIVGIDDLLMDVSNLSEIHTGLN